MSSCVKKPRWSDSSAAALSETVLHCSNTSQNVRAEPEQQINEFNARIEWEQCITDTGDIQSSRGGVLTDYRITKLREVKVEFVLSVQYSAENRRHTRLFA